MGDGDSKGSLRVTHNAEWRFCLRVTISLPQEAVPCPESSEEMKSIRVDYRLTIPVSNRHPLYHYREASTSW